MKEAFIYLLINKFITELKPLVKQAITYDDVRHIHRELGGLKCLLDILGVEYEPPILQGFESDFIRGYDLMIETLDSHLK